MNDKGEDEGMNKWADGSKKNKGGQVQVQNQDLVEVASQYIHAGVGQHFLFNFHRRKR